MTQNFSVNSKYTEQQTHHTEIMETYVSFLCYFFVVVQIAWVCFSSASAACSALYSSSFAAASWERGPCRKRELGAKLESAADLPAAVTLSATRGVKNAALEPTLCAGPSPIRVRVRVRVRVTCGSG